MSTRGGMLMVGAVLALSLSACGASGTAAVGRSSASPSGTPTASASTSPAASTGSPSPDALPILPGGGRTILPGHRVVAYYGNAISPNLGVLGRTSPDLAAANLAQAAAPFATQGTPVMGAFELIATVANGSPTANGDYSTPADDADIARYLAVARRHHLLLILDVQPGHADFLSAVQHYEKWLLQPDVSIALDAEWSMPSGVVPGERVGSTTASTINEVSAYVCRLVQAHHLPQKLLILHEFRSSMIVDRPAIIARQGLATVFHVDGFGHAATKRRVYSELHGRPPFYSGFKLFYRQDVGLMTPSQVLAMRPIPDLISYQ